MSAPIVSGSVSWSMHSRIPGHVRILPDSLLLGAVWFVVVRKSPTRSVAVPHCGADVPLPRGVVAPSEETDELQRSEVVTRAPERWTELQTQFLK